jgi:hypothetical protein
VRSSLSVDWVGLATSKRSPGVALLRPRCDFAGADRPGAHDVDRAEAGRLYGRAEIVHTSGATTARMATIAEQPERRLWRRSRLPRERTTRTRVRR